MSVAEEQSIFERLVRKETAKMTFQVALIASDGIVIGSDMKVQDAGYENGSLVPEFQAASDSKFIVGRSIACCLAGSSSDSERYCI